MTPWINVISSSPDLLMVYTHERFGGVDVHIQINDHVKDILSWVQHHRQQLEREQQRRDNDPQLRELYDQYQTYLKLTQE